MFHENIYIPDYEQTFTHEWTIDGDPEKDSNKKLGLTSRYKKGVTQQELNKAPNGDQTYTYLRVDLLEEDGEVISAIGLKQDPRGAYVKLVKGDEIINEKLYVGKNDDGYPAIVNHFTARKLGLSVGSKFNIKVVNTKDRFTKKLQDKDYRKDVTLRIVDIYDSYYNTAIFLSQEDANEILGLNRDYGYNGILTKKFTGGTQDLPMQLTNVLAGFSPSGFYSRIIVNRSSHEFHNFLANKAFNIAPITLSNNKYEQPLNGEAFKKRYGVDEDKYKSVDDLSALLEKTFGSHFALSPNIYAIENASLFNDFVFNTVSSLILSIINLFITILAPLLVCALLIITTLIIEDLKNLLVILSLLGFTHFENSVTVLLYLGLVLFTSIVLAMPLSSILLSVYVNGIFNTISIYLPIYLRFDYVLCSSLILFLMFSFSYLIANKKIKKIYLPVAVKSINE